LADSMELTTRDGTEKPTKINTGSAQAFSESPAGPKATSTRSTFLKRIQLEV
jgi:hypothetical protein